MDQLHKTYKGIVFYCWQSYEGILNAHKIILLKKDWEK